MEYPKTFDNKSGLVSKADTSKKNDGELVSVSEANQTNLIINYLPTDMTENELLNIFSKFGEVVDHKIIRHRHSGLSLGYGFVVFKNTNAARIAQIMCNGHEVRGKSLKVAFARPRSQDIVNANLHVTYLPPDIDESKLTELFGRYGTIIEVRVLRWPTGKPRGSGFVRFDQRMAAEVALNALNNYVLKEATRPITVQFAKDHKSPKDATNSGPTNKIDLGTQPAGKRCQEPNSPPRPIKRQISEEPYPFPPPVERHIKQFQVDPRIHKLQMDPDTQPFGKRSQGPNLAEIEHTAKRAGGYVVPYKHT
nr:sex-lethal homolog [Drosophila kikkawai]